jgi:hypothetical protein
MREEKGQVLHASRHERKSKSTAHIYTRASKHKKLSYDERLVETQKNG